MLEWCNDGVGFKMGVFCVMSKIYQCQEWVWCNCEFYFVMFVGLDGVYVIFICEFVQGNEFFIECFMRLVWGQLFYMGKKGKFYGLYFFC